MLYQTRLAAFIALMSYSVIGVDPVVGQTIPKSLQGGGDPETTVKDRKNAWVVGLVGGVFEGSFMRFAEDVPNPDRHQDEWCCLSWRPARPQ
jgi:hypothetical protein